MSVDTTIPDSSNNVGNDLSAIRENFELLASAQVVDEGSTSDGDYIRYENGWQITFVDIEEGVDINNDLGSLWNSDFQTMDLPVEHDSMLDYSIFLSTRETTVWGAMKNNTSNQIQYRLYSSESHTDASHTIATIGRWK